MQRLEIPETLAGIVNSQVSSIGPDLVALLEDARCIGLHFDSRVLESAAERAPEAVEDSLKEAAKQGLIGSSSSPEPTEFQFASPLIRDHLYNEMSDQRRRAFHRQLADFGTRNAGVLSPEELAIHSARGLAHVEPEAAFLACSAAAERAERAFAFDQAATFWSLALSTLEAREVRRRAEVLMRLGLTRRADNNWSQAITVLQRAHELFERLGEAESAAEAAYFLGELHRFTLNLDQSVHWLRLSLESLTEDLRPNAQALLGGTLIAQDHVEDGLATLRPLLRLVSTNATVSPHVAYWAAYGLNSAGEIEASRELSGAGLREAQRLNDRTRIALLGGQLAFDALSHFDLSQAHKYAELVASIPPPHDATGLVRMFYTRAIVDAYVGNWRGVKETCDTWMPEVRLAGHFQQATAEMIWSEASSNLGQQEIALEMAEKALPHLREMTPLATLHKARILLRSGQKDAAKEVVLSVAEKVQNSTHSSGSLLALADLAASIGDLALGNYLRPILLKEPRQLLIIYAPTSVQRVLGKLASLQGDHKAAFSHFDTAIKDLSAGGALYELAYTYLDYSNARLRHSKRGDALKSRTLLLEAATIFQALDLPQPPGDETEPPQGGSSRYGLTPRQLEVLQLVAQGGKNKEIAERLSLTPTTVARHLEAILEKTGASNRTDAVMKAQHAGLLTDQIKE